MGYELQKLNSRHKVMVSYKLRGMTNVQIAKALGISEVAVGYITNSGVFQEELARRAAEVEKIDNDDIVNNLGIARAALEREALPSVMKLAEIRDNAIEPNLARQAANDIVKAAFARENSGPAAGQLGNVIVMNVKQLNLLQQVMKELGAEDGNSERAATDGTGTSVVEANVPEVAVLPG